MMGKQWKKKERPQPELSSDYKWSSQSYTLKQILKNFKLPVVIQCSEDTNPEHLQNFFFDLRQPVLLHSRRTSRKIFARCIRKGDGGTVKELLPEVVIPEDYAGWFKISKGLEFNKPSSHRTVDSITRTNSEFFLCTTEFDAIVLTETHEDDGDGSTGSIMRPVVEGEVLRKTGVQKLNQLLIPEEYMPLERSNNYLLCIDENDCELFVPLSQTGLFYEVSDGNFNKNDNCVVQISDILDEMVEMPLYVRHILGDPPSISKFYSPCLKLVRVKEEETVMGSTLDAEEDALPLEIQSHSPIKFEIALNTPMLQSSAEYTEAVDMCNSVAQNYVTDMKLAVTFKGPPPIEESNSDNTLEQTNPAFTADENESQLSVPNSQRTSTSMGRGSELGEVEANSEFSIKWEPDMKAICQSPNDLKDTTEADSASIDSVDPEHAMKLNSMLGGQFFNANNLPQSIGLPKTVIQLNGNNVDTWNQRWHSDSDLDGTLKSEQGRPTMQTLPVNSELAPFVDVVEEVTDFSVNSNTLIEDSGSGPSTSTAILRPPSPFTDEMNSMPSSVTVSSPSKLHSSSSTIDSCRSPVDLSDHFPSIHSSVTSLQTDLSTDSNGILKPKPDGFNFTGDVYINTDVISSRETLDEAFSSNESIDGSWQSWNENKYRVIRKKKKSRSIATELDERLEMPDTYKVVPSSEDLIQFDGPSRHSSASSIITCTVGDEMVSSCNDLRLSLEEITRNARQNHTENSWRQFCLERSSSLPVRSKIIPRTQLCQTDEHSQSWEQISPRHNEKNEKTPRDNTAVKTTRTLNQLNADFSDSFGDRTHLISDTCSEDSAQYSHRSVESLDHEANTSFALSETSDLSVTDGPESILAAIAEMDTYLDGLSTSSKSSIRSDIAQQIKINHEIKRKQMCEWNDIVEVI